MLIRALIVVASASLILTNCTYSVGAAERKGRFYYEQRGLAIWDVPTGRKAVALTFDDGPDPVYTPQILDILKSYRAHVTFFVVGSQIKQHPELLLREVRQGCEIANHTYTHRDLQGKSFGYVQKEIRENQRLLTSIIHRRAVFFRPPGGYYNQAIMEASKSEGCTVVLWSWDEDSKDWTDPGTGRIIRRVVSNADAGDIVLLHDHGRNRQQTVEALRAILPMLRAEGFQFVTVSELLRMRATTRNQK